MNISYEKAALKAYAAREIENVMNRYEYMMSHDQFQYVYDNLFALDKEDVFFDVPFGRWNGRESLKRVIIGYHSSLCCDAEGNPRPGVIFYNANTQAIIEVADDLKTAKGLWVCPGYSAKDLPDGSYDCGAGTAVRACDFIYDEKDGRWKMWHYAVSGLTSHPYSVPFTEFHGDKQSAAVRVFPEGIEPDEGPHYFWMYDTSRPVNYYPFIPEPYETWDDSLSY